MILKITRQQAIKLYATYLADCLAEDVAAGYKENLVDIFIHGTDRVNQYPAGELQRLINESLDEMGDEIAELFPSQHRRDVTSVQVVDGVLLDRKRVEDFIMTHEAEKVGYVAYIRSLREGKVLFPDSVMEDTLLGRLKALCEDEEVDYKSAALFQEEGIKDPETRVSNTPSIALKAT
jgi:hypothetical protein